MKSTENTKTHNLYIIKVNIDGTNLLKFGYSSNILSRIKSYGKKAELIGTYYRKDAKAFELNYHNNNMSQYRKEYYAEDKLDNIVYSINNDKEVLSTDELWDMFFILNRNYTVTHSKQLLDFINNKVLSKYLRYSFYNKMGRCYKWNKATNIVSIEKDYIHYILDKSLEVLEYKDKGIYNYQPMWITILDDNGYNEVFLNFNNGVLLN